MALAFLLAPFFSSADSFTDGPDIFKNGNIDLKPKLEKLQFCVTASYGDAIGVVCGDSVEPLQKPACDALASSIPTSSTPSGIWPKRTYGATSCKVVNGGFELWRDITTTFGDKYDWGCRCYVPGDTYGPSPKKIGSPSMSNSSETMAKTCPPEGHPQHTYDANKDSCATPADMTMYDSCDYNDVHATPVVNPVACIKKTDGSSCGVTAVSVGGGKSVYMPSEINCYEDQYPILDENGGPNTMPDGDDGECTQDGYYNYCSAKPEDECPNGVCKAGCGNMKGQFVCITPIKKGDDDDKDDGKDGGKDDGKDGGKDDGKDGDKNDGKGGDKDDGKDGGNSGGGNSGGACDTPGNCSTSVSTKTAPSKGLKGFWKSDYPDGLGGLVKTKVLDSQDSQFYSFIETFNPSLGGGSAPPLQLCFNLGFVNFGCQDFKIDPRIYAAMRIFILITAGFTCRKILFGG